MISAILPAYNEEKTIGSTIVVLKKIPFIKEIIVVDDGSTDNTADEALKQGAMKVIRIPQNKGKGEALNIGVAKAKENILFFLDADLRGLEQKHIELLSKPVIRKELDMTIGSVDRGKGINKWRTKYESPYSGLRVFKKSFWHEIPADFKKGYFVEATLTHFAKKQELKVKGFVLQGVKHTLKEQKHGFWLGLKYRLQMYQELVLVNFLLKVRIKNKKP